jgi:Lipid A 3-O-deacylase (PagL)
MGGKRLKRSKIGVVLLLVCALYALRSADAHSLCESCEVQVGLGGTYHYWGTTGGVVLPVSVTWSENRYELGFVRVTTQQTLHESGSRNNRLMAAPYWGASLSRRWQLFERGPVKGFFGFGMAGKTKSDALSTTRWDFASQLGLRFRLPGNRVTGELTMRHWSNGGIRLPNHGQDFATLTMHLNSGLFGVSKADQYPIDPTFDIARSLAANNSGAERQLLP